eukprot:GILK01004292.1.p1 GENE.GILK01004292.1~~GILK01004292.1.p1  ORF type:complete len:723 (-),score=71.60 GILK01004292.1:243-2360(-)
MPKSTKKVSRKRLNTRANSAAAARTAERKSTKKVSRQRSVSRADFARKAASEENSAEEQPTVSRPPPGPSSSSKQTRPASESWSVSTTSIQQQKVKRAHQHISHDSISSPQVSVEQDVEADMFVSRTKRRRQSASNHIDKDSSARDAPRLAPAIKRFRTLATDPLDQTSWLPLIGQEKAAKVIWSAFNESYDVLKPTVLCLVGQPGSGRTTLINRVRCLLFENPKGAIQHEFLLREYKTVTDIWNQIVNLVEDGEDDAVDEDKDGENSENSQDSKEFRDDTGGEGTGTWKAVGHSRSVIVLRDVDCCPHLVNELLQMMSDNANDFAGVVFFLVGTVSWNKDFGRRVDQGVINAWGLEHIHHSQVVTLKKLDNLLDLARGVIRKQLDRTSVRHPTQEQKIPILWNKDGAEVYLMNRWRLFQNGHQTKTAIRNLVRHLRELIEWKSLHEPTSLHVDIDLEKNQFVIESEPTPERFSTNVEMSIYDSFAFLDSLLERMHQAVLHPLSIEVKSIADEIMFLAEPRGVDKFIQRIYDSSEGDWLVPANNLESVLDALREVETYIPQLMLYLCTLFQDDIAHSMLSEVLARMMPDQRKKLLEKKNTTLELATRNNQNEITVSFSLLDHVRTRRLPKTLQLLTSYGTKSNRRQQDTESRAIIQQAADDILTIGKRIQSDFSTLVHNYTPTNNSTTNRTPHNRAADAIQENDE